ncbi:hypothetical protein A2U01_0025274, partial [Trifolium medium]|nr:hypothetical protein [Trifolium medium]
MRLSHYLQPGVVFTKGLPIRMLEYFLHLRSAFAIYRKRKILEFALENQLFKGGASLLVEICKKGT